MAFAVAREVVDGDLFRTLTAAINAVDHERPAPPTPAAITTAAAAANLARNADNPAWQAGADGVWNWYCDLADGLTAAEDGQQLAPALHRARQIVAWLEIQAGTPPQTGGALATLYAAVAQAADDGDRASAEQLLTRLAGDLDDAAYEALAHRLELLRPAAEGAAS